MLHRKKLIKFKEGQDAKEMLLKKYVRSLLLDKKITLTLKRAKIMKGRMDKLVEKAKEKTEANKNYLLRQVTDAKLVDVFFTEVGPLFKDRQGGCLKMTRLGSRSSDGAEMALLEWSVPFVKAEKVITKKKKIYFF